MKRFESMGIRLAATLAVISALSWPAWAQSKVIARATSAPSKIAVKPAPSKTAAVSTKAVLGKPVATTKSQPRTAKKTVAQKSRRPAPKPRYPTYGNPTEGDDPSRDDAVVRAVAVDALGNMIGSVVVVDPDTGRVLTVVNQQLAFSGGYQPCSAFKPAVALAALGEGIIESDRTKLELGKKWQLDLHKALAISNNLYFETLGRLLGIDKLEQYARQFGFGEQAGWGIAPEPLGAFPNAAPPASMGGVGRVASFGQGISMTMFQLVSFTSALANGGTLYYLQYPSSTEAQTFSPMVKRELPIESSLTVVRGGMEEAVLTGTARRAQMGDLHVLGKTGTCSQDGARLGWFTGYNREAGGVALVVLLRTGQNLGGGPGASRVAAKVFRELGDLNYYARNSRSDPSRTLPASFQMPQIP